MHRQGHARVARHHRYADGQVAARALAHDRHLLRVAIEALGVLQHPAIGGQGVVVGGGEMMFRRLAIMDRDHDGVSHLGHAARPAVIDVQIGDHETAAVEIDHDRMQLVLGMVVRLVDSGLDRSGGARDGDVGGLHAQIVGFRLLAGLAQQGVNGVGRRGLLARLLGRQGLDRLAAERSQFIQHLLHGAIGLGGGVARLVVVAEQLVYNRHFRFPGLGLGARDDNPPRQTLFRRRLTWRRSRCLRSNALAGEFGDGKPAATPKAQPPRKRSGKRTATAYGRWKVALDGRADGARRHDLVAGISQASGQRGREDRRSSAPTRDRESLNHDRPSS